MEKDEILCFETARMNIYQALSQLYQLPDQHLPEYVQILAENLHHVEPELTEYVGLMQEQLSIKLDFHKLTLDFTGLFAGPYSIPAPPYGSVYIDGERKVMGDSTMDVIKRYQHFGLDISDKFNEVPDHITIELEFMFFLIFKEIESLRANLPGQTQELLLHQRSFHTDHLNIWIPAFTGCVIDHSSNKFYRNLARATRMFMAEDLAYLEDVSLLETL